MKKTILTITLLTLLLITGCAQEQRNQEELLIITSSFPLYEFAREIAGETDQVEMLIPPGTDVHHYDLKPSDLIKLEQADLIIFIGEEMEPWLETILDLEGKHKDKTIQATKKVQLIKAKHEHDHDENNVHDEDEHEIEHIIKKIDYVIHEWEDNNIGAEEALEEIEKIMHNAKNKNSLIHEIDYVIHEWEDNNIGAEEALEEIEQIIHKYLDHEHDYEDEHDHAHDSEYDPHVWLDFENNIEIVNAITSKLSTLKPENKETYRKNANEYIQQLRELHNNYEETLRNCETRTFITNHDSFRYLANKYDLKQIPIRGLSAEQEPNPRTIANIIKEAKEHDVRHVFFEELASPRVSEALAKELKAETLMISPGENIPARDWGRKTFIDLMQENLENLKIGLRCT
jgi:zinc transport system substrate-binding protein